MAGVTSNLLGHSGVSMAFCAVVKGFFGLLIGVVCT